MPLLTYLGTYLYTTHIRPLTLVVNWNSLKIHPLISNITNHISLTQMHLVAQSTLPTLVRCTTYDVATLNIFFEFQIRPHIAIFSFKKYYGQKIFFLISTIFRASYMVLKINMGKIQNLTWRRYKRYSSTYNFMNNQPILLKRGYYVRLS